MVTLGIATLFSALGINLYTYDRLTRQESIADIHIIQESPHEFEVNLHLKDGRKLKYKMIGDGWRLDSKVIVWKPQASLFGLDPVYKLDGIQNQFQNRETKTVKHITSYRLSEEMGMDAVTFFKKYQKWMPWLDSAFGSSVYMPLADRAHYQVSITLSGLKANAINKEAEAAVKNWQM